MKRKTLKVSFDIYNLLELRTDYDVDKLHALYIQDVYKVEEHDVDSTILRHFANNQYDSQVLEDERIEKLIKDNYIDRITFWISLLEQAYRKSVSY